MYEIIVNTEIIEVIDNPNNIEIIDSSTVIDLTVVNQVIEVTDSIIPVKGDKGDPYTSVSYEFLAPLLEWSINHNKNSYPSVIVVDSNNKKCEGHVSYPDLNNVLIKFAFPFAGKAIVN